MLPFSDISVPIVSALVDEADGEAAAAAALTETLSVTVLRVWPQTHASCGYLCRSFTILTLAHIGGVSE